VLIDDPNQEAIFAASFQIELIRERLKRLTVAPTSSAALGLHCEAQTAVGKLRELNQVNFDGSACNSDLLDLMKFELTRIVNMATTGRQDGQLERECRCCNSSLSASEEGDLNCSTCVDAFFPLFSELETGFKTHLI